MTRIHGVLGLFVRCPARRAYFGADAEARQAWAEFTAAGDDSQARQVALLWAADCERTMAANVSGWRHAAKVDGDGFTLAQSHDMAALLLTMVADTEHHEPGVHRWTRRTDLHDERHVADVLDALTMTRSPRARAVLTLALYETVVGRVGGQAAEVLAAGVAYGYYRMAGVSDTEARWLTGPDGPRWTR